MNFFKHIFPLLICSFALFASCEENTPTIGSSITEGEVTITIDTITLDLNAKAVEIKNFDSKTGNLMIGSIQHESYGKLSCSFVTRFMCSASLSIPDSLFNPERVDSCKLILGADRNDIIGDSLAPQKMSVFTLTKQLPSDIDNTFDPAGYYNPSSPLASRNYTVSSIAEKDSGFYQNTFVDLNVSLPVDLGKEIIAAYKDHPEYFSWPETMAKEFLPGIYVQPTFGNGCIANIQSVFLGVFYHHFSLSITNKDDETIVKVNRVPDVVFPFSVSPEVLSSNIIDYTPSEKINQKNSNNDGEVVITTPGGYIADFEFPAQKIIDDYAGQITHLTTVNELTLYLPADTFDPEAGIGVTKNLLLIKESEYENFFEKNKTPDNLTSFTGTYDSTNNRYYFSSLRNYFLTLLAKDKIEPEDVKFRLVPVEIETETVSSYYGDSSTFVTKCTPYTSKPTMTLLKTNAATVTLSFSTQVIQ